MEKAWRCGHSKMPSAASIPKYEFYPSHQGEWSRQRGDLALSMVVISASGSPEQSLSWFNEGKGHGLSCALKESCVISVRLVGEGVVSVGLGREGAWFQLTAREGTWFQLAY